ncbi:hypothetical protein [uncultured Pseudacidovorax sp.]|uniref:Uncharacterized protein n=2 Tax=Pseudacidovorax intermedius TaxID=433924 RepID=A0A147H9V0_9BURK|nr:hypothetical protein [uncultured Pseudacidovorax sp.]KTT26737.1 hypothetical protein NS331_03275 [Pseudacidovorax intermedius]
MMNFLIRLVLVFLGLVFAASLAVVALLLALGWMVHSAWARLTGKPVSPLGAAAFGGRFDPRAGFERFRAAAEARKPARSAADEMAARARGELVPAGRRGFGADVSDVSAKPAGRED